VQTLRIAFLIRKENSRFQEQDTTRPYKYFSCGRVKCGEVMSERIIDLNDKITDNNANRKET
jgi:hypothetical protein